MTSHARPSTLRLILANRLSAIGMALFVLILLTALAAPLLPLPDPDATDTAARLRPPFSPGHLLGTDPLGRDVLSRLVWGTRVSLAVGIGATLVAAVLGTALGLVAGYAGPRTDTVLMRLVDMLMAFPYVLLALAIVAVLGPGLINALYAIAVVNIPFFARNIRGRVLGLSHQPFVEAARLSGKGHLSILATEIFPNILPVIVVTMSSTVGWMILETAGLSFLGLGAQPPQADLGSMLGQGRAQLFTAAHVALVPGLMIFILVMSINLAGDGIRDVLDPRLRSGALARPQPVTEIARRAAPPAQARKAPLAVDSLSVGFRSGKAIRPAVRDVSLTLGQGECLGVIGESGSGKSVTALSIMGLVTSPPGVITGGAIRLDGHDLMAQPSRMASLRGARVAYIFQDPLTSLHPMMPIGRQIAEAVTAHRPVGRTEARRRTLALMEQVGLPDPAGRYGAYPHQLSGGQRQRVGIAMALANDPDILVADEPTTALDVTVQARILTLLKELQRGRGLSLLLITHDFGVVAGMCDRVAVMKDGSIVEEGATRDVLAAPSHAYTRRLIASVPRPGEGRHFLSRVRAMRDVDALEARA
ncbi:dipeptide/oligopeptide/nickel ABC transporter permease/ATP-binding protein [Aureimonas altamirensis]|uniref:dipeptide/oligopeptide/nickel ABC transporter permease/ATP-binding protein n=1 Tax=Aureimonas altamirensis TaxID=370622 RepID=UPI0020374AF5|nr:dipeptide/oligopeptide/nickel ABC transporter permease/ATP-binding protein [Aureimonas altamirensis]MCM2504585.1 dipeptide/oligopeptide/nickel ABC transporter permease/ATP-binding protein [Aureimonas altamirensis]